MDNKIAVLVLANIMLLTACKEDVPQRPNFAHSTLSVVRQDGTRFPFSIEIANSDAEQSYGLMFIHSLASDAGMIFPYSPPREVAFWMKNTLIPLDMLFVRPDHTIGKIVTNARPGDLSPISSDEPVIGVVEIAGGQVVKDGFAVGDRVETTMKP